MFKLNLVVVFFLFINCVCGIYVIDSNTTSTNRNRDKPKPIQPPTDWTEFGSDGLWSSILEDWTLSQTTTREGKVLQPNHKYIPTNGFYITKRMGQAPRMELEPHMRPPDNMISQPSGTPSTQLIPPAGPSSLPYISQSQQQQHQQHQNTLRQNMAPSPREVSETDLYLLGAIEKLVYRVDYMEKRLRRTEQLVYYLMQGNNQKEEPCPDTFNRVGPNCYHFGVHRELNWKSANSMCKSLGSHLAEFETKTEYQQLTAHLLNHDIHKGKDFWLGGLNPGLLWIWSNSAKPVNPNANLTSISNLSSNNNVTKIKGNTTTKPKDSNNNSKERNDDVIEIKGTGRCLRFSYNPALHKYGYSGLDCSGRFNYICEYQDQTLDNEISRISKELNLPE